MVDSAVRPRGHDLFVGVERGLQNAVLGAQEEVNPSATNQPVAVESVNNRSYTPARESASFVPL